MEKFPEFIANHLFLFSLFVAITSLLLWNIFMSVSGVVQISSAGVTRLINHEDAVIFDLRSVEAFEQGHIINAINMAVVKLTEEEHALKKYKDRSIVICCQRGQESVRVVRSLKAKGLLRLYCLKGGVEAWKSDNLPLIRGNA